jgi:hypothetical protein
LKTGQREIEISPQSTNGFGDQRLQLLETLVHDCNGREVSPNCPPIHGPLPSSRTFRWWSTFRTYLKVFMTIVTEVQFRANSAIVDAAWLANVLRSTALCGLGYNARAAACSAGAIYE